MSGISSTTIESAYEQRKLRARTMRLSIIEGAFAVIALGLQQAFYIPYLNHIGATKLQIGIGAGLPSLATGLIQIWTPSVLLHSRAYRKIVALSTLAQAFCFIPFALMYYIAPDNPIWYSLAAITVSSIAAGVGAGAWSDWMSHIVPRRRRGKYFALRTRTVTIVQLAISVVAGYYLDHVAAKIILVFTMIWFACFAARSVSGILFFFHYEPPGMISTRPIDISFWSFLSRIFSIPFGRFVIAASVLNLGINFSQPFFVIHALNNLNFSYIQYTAIQIAPTAATILSLGLWGRVCDRIGDVLPMRLCVILIAVLPLPWILSGDFRILLAGAVLQGIAMGGYSLASFNYTLWSISSAQRTAFIAYLNVISCVFIFVGSALGGIIGPLLPKITAFQMHSNFIFSILIRLIPLMLFRFIREDKPKNVKMTTIERFFFDPRHSWRPNSPQATFDKQKHTV